MSVFSRSRTVSTSISCAVALHTVKQCTTAASYASARAGCAAIMSIYAAVLLRKVRRLAAYTRAQSGLSSRVCWSKMQRMFALIGFFCDAFAVELMTFACVCALILVLLL